MPESRLKDTMTIMKKKEKEKDSTNSKRFYLIPAS